MYNDGMIIYSETLTLKKQIRQNSNTHHYSSLSHFIEIPIPNIVKLFDLKNVSFKIKFLNKKDIFHFILGPNSIADFDIIKEGKFKYYFAETKYKNIKISIDYISI